jgi:propionyl-CoA synthetase
MLQRGDRHVQERADQAALSFYSTEVDQETSYTYGDLHREVQTFAGALQALGVERDERVIIYLPMIPEAVFATLAWVWFGPIHSGVFAGFAPASLATRIDDAARKAEFPPMHAIVCDRGLGHAKGTGLA